MALQLVLSVDTNQVVSGQPITCTLTVTNPQNGTACNITQIAPRIGVIGAGTAAANIGRPLLNLPEAPFYLGSSSTGPTVGVFTWKESLYMTQQPYAQPNAPVWCLSLTMTVDVYTTDSTGVYTANVANLYIFPSVGVNANSAVAPAAGGTTNFSFNNDAWLAGMLSAPVPL